MARRAGLHGAGLPARSCCRVLASTEAGQFQRKLIIGRTTHRELPLKANLKFMLSVMANLQLLRASPPEGFSIARKVMDDVIARYLYKDGAAVARAHVENIASEIIRLYDDGRAAYDYAMAKISEAEEQERQRWMREFADLMHPKKKTAQSAESSEPVVLPPKLSTEKAMLMWKLLQEAGYIDDRYQPKGLSRADAALVAYHMLIRLPNDNEFLTTGIPWKPFVTLWNRPNLKSDYPKAKENNKYHEFNETLTLLFDRNGIEPIV